MCWHVEESDAPPSDTPITSWIAPSWSWAAHQGTIRWDEDFAKCFLGREPDVVSAREAMSVNTYDVRLVDDDPFGALQSASLIILGQLQHCLAVQGDKGFYVFDMNGFDLGGVILDHPRSELFLSAEKRPSPDSFVDCGLKSLGVFSLLLLATSTFARKRYDRYELPEAMYDLPESLEYETEHKCLLLQPVKDKYHTFYRIGLATLRCRPIVGERSKPGWSV
jgi:hypothetical protein